MNRPRRAASYLGTVRRVALAVAGGGSIVALVAVAGLAAAQQLERPARPRRPFDERVAPEPDPSPRPPERRRGRAVPPVCANGQPALAAAEAEAMVRAAAAALDEPRLVAAVVDRLGRPLAVYAKPGAAPADPDVAVGLARTGAFFSNDQAPLSSRTVRFVSGVHFPPGVARAPNAALYGIENTNRGCDLRVAFNSPQAALPPARSVVDPGAPCDAVNGTGGCGTGPVTGKPQPFDAHPPGQPGLHDPAAVAVDPGGIPIFRGPALVGGIGVYAPGAPPPHREFAALAGFVAAGLGPAPQPLPGPGVVFIDGIRLPFVRQVDRPAGSTPDAPQGGSLLLGAVDGACAPEGWLAGPYAGAGLTGAEVDLIVEQSRQAAERTRAVIRLPLGSRARMVIAVSDLDGEILGLFRMPDATVFSVDVAVAKARNVIFYSQGNLPGVPAGTAVTNRTISFGAQPLFPAGIDSTQPGPFFQLYQDDLATPCSQGFDPASPNRNGVVFFPGSIPLYRGGQLVGGLGISGDGVEQDDYVSFLGAEGFRPPESQWADRITLRGVRLPFLKFPRNPEG